MTAGAGAMVVRGRVGADGRLLSAEAPLAAIQEGAGGKVGAALAIMQVAAIARLARRLAVPVSRPATVAMGDEDIALWIEAVPDGDGEVALAISGWKRQPARLSLVAGLRNEPEEEAGQPEVDDGLDWTCDEGLVVTAMGSRLERMIGLGPGEASGQPLTRLVRLLPDEVGNVPLLEALAGRDGLDEQKAVSRRGDMELRLSAVPEVDEAGHFRGFRGKALVEEGGEDDKIAPASDAGLAIDAALHDALSSPLDRIIHAADRIVARADGPLRSDYASYASDIAAAGRHLMAVISAIGEGGREAAEAVDVGGLAREAAGLSAAAARAGQVDVVVEQGEARFLARGQARGILQILVNVIGNAVRHSPEGGTVAVVFEQEGGEVRVTVADQGPGIARADQQRIFERFEQGEGKSGSAGLGLAISRRLARSMGGDIELVSAPGEGARFTLILPAA